MKLFQTRQKSSTTTRSLLRTPANTGTKALSPGKQVSPFLFLGIDLDRCLAKLFRAIGHAPGPAKKDSRRRAESTRNDEDARVKQMLLPIVTLNRRPGEAILPKDGYFQLSKKAADRRLSSLGAKPLHFFPVACHKMASGKF